MDEWAILDRMADEVTAQYAAFLDSVTASLARTLDGPNPEAPATRREFENSLLRPQNAFYSAFNAKVPADEQELMDDALKRTGARLSASERETLNSLVAEMRQELHYSIYAMMVRDGGIARRVLTRFAFEVDGKLLQGMSRIGAIITSRPGKVASLKFEQVDRANRRWKSSQWVRTVTRSHLLQVHIETALYGIQKRGGDLAVVTHESVTHQHSGLVFAITGKEEQYPTYSDIRDEVWHPNSRAFVAAF
jgi:hypothetical protein